MAMDQHDHFLHSAHFKQMKAQQDAHMSFDGERVTGIFGPNGHGKSTVLHALACIFKPLGGFGEQHRFSDFFKSERYQNWDGSAFDIDYSYAIKGRPQRVRHRFVKPKGRWMRDYDSRPSRPVFYIGIDTCIPDIEHVPNTVYKVNLGAEKGLDKKLPKEAAIVMRDRSYVTVNECSVKYKRNDSLMVVDTGAGVKRTSLNLGAGEQRLFRILNVLLCAPKFSLILIDELDLTLHTAALDRLVSRMVAIANDKKLQIIFTSHREELLTRNDINIRHVFQIDNKTLVFDSTNSECLDRLSGKTDRPLDIFVEDNYAKSLVEQIALEEGVKRRINVYPFGAARNAFNVGIGLLLKNQLSDNVIIVLDGDVYKSQDERMDMLQKIYSGNEPDKDVRCQKILGRIRQFSLPIDTPPERFLHDLLCASPNDTELRASARSVVVVPDSHKYITSIIEDMGMSPEVVVYQIVQEVRQTQSWNDYTSEVRQWLRDRKAALKL